MSVRLGHIALLVAAGLPLRAAAQAPAKPDTTKKPLPLVATRSIDIDTDEGSWISVDVTPDGRTIVFDFLGDIYDVPIGGGQATPLTSGMAFDGQPRVSPDGKWIAFTSDRDGAENVWILNRETRETRQITRLRDKVVQSPEWAPDGNYIVATVGDIVFLPGKLWMFHIDGGAGVQLTKSPPNTNPFAGTLTTGAAFGPDGRFIWYAQRQGTWQYNAIYPQFQLAVFDRQSGRNEQRTSRFGSAIRPTLSPDGKWLVYATRYEAKTGLVLRDLESGDEKWLAYPVQRDEQEAIPSRDAYPGMSFTPDSKGLVATYGGKIWRIPVDGGAPVAVPFHVKARLDLGPLAQFKYPIPDSSEFTVRQIRDAVASPDGKRLAFVALDRLYVMDYPGGSPRRLTRNDEVEAEPVWSPDGQSIAFVTWSRTGGLLYKVRADGTQPADGAHHGTRHLAAAGVVPGRESPGGRPRARVRTAGRGRSPIRGIGRRAGRRSRGGRNADLDRTHFGRLNPHFGSDSSRIYLWAGDSGLVSIRWDGTDERRHLKVTGPNLLNQEKPGAADLVLMAPRGDRAVVQAGYDLYLVTVPLVGEPATVTLNDPKAAAVPATRLTDIGGEFPTWGADGRHLHWSLGNAHVVYDLGLGDRGRPADRSRKNCQGRRRKGHYQGRLHGDEAVRTEGDPDRRQGASGSARGNGCPPGCQGRHDARDRDPGECRRGGTGIAHRARRAEGRRTERRARRRCEREDHRARIRRHPRAHVAGMGTPQGTAMDVSRESRLRRHDHARPADRRLRRAVV